MFGKFWTSRRRVEALEARLRDSEAQRMLLEAEIKRLREELSRAPKPQPPESPIEFVTQDQFGNNYYTFKSEEQITVWRAEGIFKAINNSYLSVSDADLIEHEQMQNELFVKLSVARQEEKTEIYRQYFFNSARLQERLKNCGEYQFLLTLSKLVMICEGEPLEWEKSASWDSIKTQRLKEDPHLLGFFLPKAAVLNAQLKHYQTVEQTDWLVRLVNLALRYQTNTETNGITT